MNITKINLFPEQISGNAEGGGILLDEADGFEYVDGKKTDKQTHMKYTVVFQDNEFEKVIVKVPSAKPVVTKEQLAQQSGKIRVRFKNLTGKFYRTNSGEYALSCNADSVEVVQ